jgi:hypothetical protein
MKIDELSASDFPGIDEVKFGEYKALKLKDKRRKKFIGNYISPPIGFVLVLIAKSNVWAWQKRGDVDWTMALFILFSIYVVVISVYLDIATKPLQRLSKELKMSARLKAKKKGILFAG